MLHVPVLLNETIELLAPSSEGLYVDATLGLGGHTREILEKSKPDGKVIGFERDATALTEAQLQLAPFGDRVTLLHRNYAEIKEGLLENDIGLVDGLLLDLGLSSLQLDNACRGFTFKGNGPLDMRMDSRDKITAADILNNEDENELADIFYYYGEERHSRKIASRIVEQRKKFQFKTVDQLAEVVAQAIPKRFQPKKIHVATKVFQALRIAVNDELGNLATILNDAVDVLKPGGKFLIISFHSLEDRMVKRRFKDDPAFKVVTKKPVVPTDEERHQNPRARSAKLRVAIRRNRPSSEGTK